MRFDGNDILGLNERDMSRLRGDRLAMIFQEPMTSLNPAYTVGSQMAEVLTRHRGGTKRAQGMRSRLRHDGIRVGQQPGQRRDQPARLVQVTVRTDCGVGR